MRWGIPYREALIVLGHDVKPFRDTEALAAAREFLADAAAPGGPNILVLAGPKGVGKTCAGVYVADVADPPLRFGLRWSEKQHPIFRHVTDLSAMGLFDRDAKEDARRQQLVTAKVVVLDDLGTEYQDKGGLFLALLDWFLDKRYGSGGITVVTTNLGAEEFRAAYGERIYDRLVERCAWRDINHESLRG
jgi:DNA replication protein DnaC